MMPYKSPEERKEYHKQYSKKHYQENKKEYAEKNAKYEAEHKEELGEYRKKWRKNNKEKCNSYTKKWRENNKDYYLQYREDNKDVIRAQQNAWAKTKRNTKPERKLRGSISQSVAKAVKRAGATKNGSILKFLPYTMEELRIHLQAQFEPWMNWTNHGKYNRKTWIDNDPTTWTWNIDHIIPQSELLYSSMAEESFQKCWSLSNLRPLSAKQNLLDSDRSNEK
jgi:hypothetical protein